MPTSTVDLIDTALVTGGYSGIGRAISESLIKSGKKVIIAGRTEAKAKQAASEMGATAYYVLDTSDVSSIPAFTKKLMSEHPSVNCLINNAGVQRPFQFPGSGGKDYDFEPSKADAEIDTNIRGPMHLILSLLPHFTSLPEGKPGVIMNISSVLGFLPSSVINPVYNGTKAWLHFFTLNMRTQFSNGPNASKLKIVEIAPPTVSTELHRERVDPKDNSKEKNSAALSLDEFMADVEKGWKEGKDMIAPGPASAAVDAWYGAFGEKYEKATKK